MFGLIALCLWCAMQRCACRHLVLGVGLSLVNTLKSGVFRRVNPCYQADCSTGPGQANRDCRRPRQICNCGAMRQS
jgi:hypothetical protein